MSYVAQLLHDSPAIQSLVMAWMALTVDTSKTFYDPIHQETTIVTAESRVWLGHGRTQFYTVDYWLADDEPRVCGD